MSSTPATTRIRLDLKDNAILTGKVIVGAIAFYLLIRQLWHPPAGIIVQGLIVGSLTALIAFGISLIYRSNRIINFAQADLGAIPTIITLTLLNWRPGRAEYSRETDGILPYFVAIPLGIVIAIVLGVVIERLFIRPFRKAPRLILMVATIGLAQILAGLAIAIPRIITGYSSSTALTIRPPFDFDFEIAPVVFRANDLLALVSVVGLSIGLLLFLRYTRIGIAARASAQSSDLASLLGVNVINVQRVVWIVATILATVAMILRAGILGFPVGTAFGPPILLRALAAAVIGRMESYAAMFVAAAAIGVIDVSVLWHTGSSALVDPVLFAVVVVALLMQRRRGASRVDDQDTSSWRDTVGTRPIPRELARLPEVRIGRFVAWGSLVTVLLAIPFWFDVGKVNLAAAAAIFGIIAVSLVILTGWAGDISLGQMGFVGLGAAVSGMLNAYWQWDLLLTVLAAGVAGALVALLVGLPALRIRGLFLTVTTLAFALAMSSYALNKREVEYLPDDILEPIQRLPILGRLDISSEASFYYVCITILVLVIWSVRGLQRTRTFRVLNAARENERATQSFGINLAKARLIGFSISGFYAALGGGLFALHQQAIGETVFASVESIRALTIVVVGGVGSIPGAMLGTIFVKSTEWFNTFVPQDFRFFFTFVGSGVGLLTVLTFFPAGLGALMFDIRDGILRKVASRRRLEVTAWSRAGAASDHPPAADDSALPPVAAAPVAEPAVSDGDVAGIDRPILDGAVTGTAVESAVDDTSEQPLVERQADT